jgi:hypothetical protein
MSKITITNNIKDKSSKAMKVGQYYRDRTTGDVFILAKHGNTEQHSLICLRDGCPYSSDSAQKPIGAFCNDEEDFDLIENVEIVIS